MLSDVIEGFKGEAGECPICEQRRVYQCTWDASNDDRDNGVVHVRDLALRSYNNTTTTLINSL